MKWLMVMAGYGLIFSGGTLISFVSPLAGFPLIFSGFMLVVNGLMKQEKT